MKEESIASRGATTLPHAVAMGIMGASVTMVAGPLGLPTWLVFLTWLGYFLFAKRPSDGAKLFLQIATGMAAALGIALGAALSAGAFGGLAFPLFVVLAVVVLAMTEAFATFGPVPPYFLGMIAAFALPLRAEARSLGIAAASVALGLVAAIFTASLRGAIYRWQASPAK